MLTLFYECTRHHAFSRQRRAQFSKDVFAFVLWRYVAVQILRVKELFVPGIVASTIKERLLNSQLSGERLLCSQFYGDKLLYSKFRG